MKKLFKFALMLMAMTVSMSLTTSCSSSDDDEEDGETENLEAALPEEARALLGCWENANSSGTYYMFFADGVCWKVVDPGRSSSSSSYRIGWYATHTKGTWTYEPSTKMLVTTIDGGMWTVAQSSTDSWVGLAMESVATQRFKKVSAGDYNLVKVVLTAVEWRSQDGLTLKTGYIFPTDYGCAIEIPDNVKRILGTYSSYTPATFGICNGSDYTFDYYTYTLSSGRYYRSNSSYGTVTLKNLTNSAKLGLVFKNTDGEVIAEFGR